MSSTFNEGANIQIRAFVSIPGSSVPLTITDIDPLAGVDLHVYDGATLVYDLDGIAASSVFVQGSPQFWSFGDQGYNLNYVISGGAFTPIGGKSYLIKFIVHTVAYGDILVKKLAQCVSDLGGG